MVLLPSGPHPTPETKQHRVTAGETAREWAVRNWPCTGVARFQDLPDRPVATAELIRGVAAVRVFDGLHLGGWTEVVKVNKASVTIGGGFRIAMGKVADWR